MKVKHFRYIMAPLAALSLIVSAEAGKPAATPLPENRVIYEVFVRNFSPEGNLKGVEAQIPRLKELGVDVIWLMPIYKLGDIGKWGSYSSPYAIKDYRRIDPDNGTEQDLHDLVRVIHENGMEIWMDWVGNHTSMDNVWVSTNPEFYSRTESGDFIHPFGGQWKDVYELNPDSGAMQDEMVECMKYWVENFDIDGFRCDYASGPSSDLWAKASSSVLKDGKRVTWLAEDSNKPSLVANGYFDYNYCWDFQDKVLKGFVQNPDVQALRRASLLLGTTGLTEGESKEPIKGESSPYNGRSRMIYLVNHDVVQDQGGTEDIIYGKYLRPLTVLQFTLYGMPLIYNGQEIQYKSGGPVSVAERTPIDWSNPDENMTRLIKVLIRLKHSSPALRTGALQGTMTNLTTDADDQVYAFQRSYGDDHVIVMLNFSDKAIDTSILTPIPEGSYREVITDQIMEYSGQPITIPALGAAVFEYQDAE